METIKIARYQSPAGELIIGSFRDQLCLCDWNIAQRRLIIDRRLQQRFNTTYETGSSDIIIRAIDQLNRYFAGQLKAFDIPLAFTGSEFQRTVWNELTKIPYGTTISYSELAQRINNPQAVLAAASANAANPISIFVPCHRVIGRDHRLTGYSGGLDAKRTLLDLERHSLATAQFI